MKLIIMMIIYENPEKQQQIIKTLLLFIKNQAAATCAKGPARLSVYAHSSHFNERRLIDDRRYARRQIDLLYSLDSFDRHT